MIVNIRGTGGSGKSTVVRRIMEHYPNRVPINVLGRKQPQAYRCFRVEHDGTAGSDPVYSAKPLYVVGHYETACGGGDTIKTPAEVFDLVRKAAETGDDVLFEGIISQDDTTRTIELARTLPLTVLFLNTPLAECLAGIQARRDLRGDERPLNPKNTESRMKRCLSHYSKLRDAGLSVEKFDRESAYLKTTILLGIALPISLDGSK